MKRRLTFYSLIFVTIILIIFLVPPKNPAIIFSLNLLIGFFIYLVLGNRVRKRLALVVSMAIISLISLKTFNIFDPLTIVLCVAAFTGLALLVK